MNAPGINREKKNTSLPLTVAALLLLAALAATFVRAGIRENAKGETIPKDLVAPAGAGRTTDPVGNTIQAALGQAAGNPSTVPTGHQLFHGFHAPFALPPPPPFPASAKNWENY